MSGVLYGLLAALTWGAADFSGGQAARRHHQFQVLVIVAGLGLLVMLGLSLALAEQLPALVSCLWAAAAGVSAALGLASFYRGLAEGDTALVSPAAAVIGASLPVLVSWNLQGLPAVQQLAGFGFGLAGIWLVSHASSRQPPARLRGLGLAFLAGLGFAGFFICLAQVQAGNLFATLAVAKGASLLTALVVLRIRRLALIAPGRNRLALLAGVLDAGGNVFYLLAVQQTRLDVAVVLSSLYPAVTVLLARLVLREHVTGLQGLGVGCCLAAVALITV